MKKYLTVSLFVLVIIGGIWFGSAGTRIAEDDSSVGPDSLVDGGNISGDDLTIEDASLKSEAMKIIDEPVVVKARLSEASEKLALEKIKESSDLIRLNYNYANPWYDLGAYRKLIGDYDGAIRVWSFIKKIRPDDYVSLSNLGDLYAFTLGDYSRAEEYFLESIARNPQNVDAYIQIALIYEYHDTPKLTLTEPLLLNGISANPKDSNLKIALGRYYQKVGDLESARFYFEKALEADPGNSALEEELKILGD